MGIRGFLGIPEWYWFDVCTIEGDRLGSYQEQRKFPNRHQAYNYFVQLAAESSKRGYGYLSQWGLGKFPEDRVYGCNTDNPRKVIGSGS